jgi:tetratricopeptide (TPR) repeat protein
MSTRDHIGTVWYVEAKDVDGKVVNTGSAVAVRLKRSNDQSLSETYLLTCVHVVRRHANNKSHYGDILSKLEGYRPGVGYNPDQAVQLKIVDEMIDQLPTDLSNAADDWVLLRIQDQQTASSCHGIDACGDLSAISVKICGYPGGKKSFVNSVVQPTETSDTFTLNSHDLGVLRIQGHGSRSGMSGGGVFEVSSKQFLGLHRAKHDQALHLHAVAATHIFTKLEEMGYIPKSYPANRIPDRSENDDAITNGSLIKRGNNTNVASYTSLFPWHNVIETEQNGVLALGQLLQKSPENLSGRKKELQQLDRIWRRENLDAIKVNVCVISGLGGLGKSSLISQWIKTRFFDENNWSDVYRYLDWTCHDESPDPTLFIEKAIAFLDGKIDPNEGPTEMGNRLARLMGSKKTLLILDGIEALQQPPGALAGMITDPGICSLLLGLAKKNEGLCIVTARSRIPELTSFEGKQVVHIPLPDLSDEEGAELLFSLGVKFAGMSKIEKDDKELKMAASESRGHALTLQLLGRYIAGALKGDIRKRDVIRMSDANAYWQEKNGGIQFGPAYRSIERYVDWFRSEDCSPSERTLRQQQISFLQLLGFFNRPATHEEYLELLSEKIEEVNEPLYNIDLNEFHLVASRLRDTGLISLLPDPSNPGFDLIDTHPIIRSYFAEKQDGIIKTPSYASFRPERGIKNFIKRIISKLHRKGKKHDGWCKGHLKLLKLLLQKPIEERPTTLADLQPLYHAVTHGCNAGLHERTLHDVYINRIMHGTESQGFYSSKKLGATLENLNAIGAFFEYRWTSPNIKLSLDDRAWVLNEAAYELRSLGRIVEARDAFAHAFKIKEKSSDFLGASIAAGNLSETEVILGMLASARENAISAINFARYADDPSELKNLYGLLGSIYHQSGERENSNKFFDSSREVHQRYHLPGPWIRGVTSFQFFQLRVAEIERTCWLTFLGFPVETQCLQRSRELIAQLEGEFIYSIGHESLINTALGGLMFNRIKIYSAFLNQKSIRSNSMDSCIMDLRKCGETEFLICGLITRAWHTARTKRSNSIDDLNLAWTLASRGPFELLKADILLTRFRLFGLARKRNAGNHYAKLNRPALVKGKGYPWVTGRPDQDLIDAFAIINQCGYFLRKKEIDDLLNTWGQSPRI